MTESTRERFERDEAERLSPFATRSSDATRRLPVEDEGRAFDYRTPFQRDRDRIVYSRAFRRLRHKAQAGILPEYEDHRRNRLTHTLEVTQLARTLARALRLNEDLVEAVALGHDLGQPPFGPAGARALDDLLRGRLDGRGGTGLGDLGGFRCGWQSLRVVDQLEKRYDHPGLNLTDAVREGILKTCDAEPPGEPTEGLRADAAPVFEVQIVRLADRLGSAMHDLDDALQSGAVEVARVERLRAGAELRRKLGHGYRARAGRFVKANAIHRGLTHLLVTGAVIAGRRALDELAERLAGGTVAPTLDGDELGPGTTGETLLEEIEGFLTATVHRGRSADLVEAHGRRVVLGLFAAYHADPRLLEDHVLFRAKTTLGVRFLRDLPRERVEDELDRRYRAEPRFVRILADYIAGMTDAYAAAEHARLIRTGAVPIPSAERLRRERLD